MKIPLILIVGPRDVAENQVYVRNEDWERGRTYKNSKIVTQILVQKRHC